MALSKSNFLFFILSFLFHYLFQFFSMSPYHNINGLLYFPVAACYKYGTLDDYNWYVRISIFPTFFLQGGKQSSRQPRVKARMHACMAEYSHAKEEKGEKSQFSHFRNACEHTRYWLYNKRTKNSNAFPLKLKTGNKTAW